MSTLGESSVDHHMNSPVCACESPASPGGQVSSGFTRMGKKSSVVLSAADSAITEQAQGEDALPSTATKTSPMVRQCRGAGVGFGQILTAQSAWLENQVIWVALEGQDGIFVSAHIISVR